MWSDALMGYSGDTRWYSDRIISHCDIKTEHYDNTIGQCDDSIGSNDDPIGTIMAQMSKLRHNCELDDTK